MDSLYEFCEIYSHVEGSNAVLPELSKKKELIAVQKTKI